MCDIACQYLSGECQSKKKKQPGHGLFCRSYCGTFVCGSRETPYNTLHSFNFHYPSALFCALYTLKREGSGNHHSFNWAYNMRNEIF